MAQILPQTNMSDNPPLRMVPPCDADSVARAKARTAERAAMRCIECHRPLVEHFDTTGIILIGCPVLRPDAQVTNGLTVLVEWFGAEGVQNFLDFIDEHGTQDLRRRLAILLSVKGGR